MSTYPPLLTSVSREYSDYYTSSSDDSYESATSNADYDGYDSATSNAESDSSQSVTSNDFDKLTNEEEKEFMRLHAILKDMVEHHQLSGKSVMSQNESQFTLGALSYTRARISMDEFHEMCNHACEKVLLKLLTVHPELDELVKRPRVLKTFCETCALTKQKLNNFAKGNNAHPRPYTKREGVLSMDMQGPARVPSIDKGWKYVLGVKEGASGFIWLKEQKTKSAAESVPNH